MAQKRAGGETVLPHKMMGWMSQFFQPWNYMKQGTQSWCSETSQRDAVGREVGRGFRMGGHVHPWLIHVDVWQKPS